MIKKKADGKTKITKETKKKVDYCDFIKVVIYKHINKNIQKIKEICSTYQGIEPAPVECWKWLDELIVSINKEYLSFPHEHNIYSDREYGRTYNLVRANYALVHKVREYDRKRFILAHIDDMDDDEDYRIHKCNMIYQNISGWLSETSRLKKDNSFDD